MKKNKIIVAILVVFVSLTFGGNAFAGSQTIHLYTNQTSVHSASIETVRAKASNVYNYSYSERDVYCELWRADYYGGNKKIVSHLVEPTETYYSGWYDYVPPAWNTFQLNLNPYGWLTAGCRAYGTLVYE